MEYSKFQKVGSWGIFPRDCWYDFLSNKVVFSRGDKLIIQYVILMFM